MPKCSRFGHWECFLIDFSYTFDMPQYTVLALPILMILQAVVCLTCILSSPALDYPFLQGALIPVIKEWHLETTIWERGVLLASEGVTISMLSLSGESWVMCVCLETHTYSPISMHFHIYPSANLKGYHCHL